MKIPTSVPEKGFYYHYKHDPNGLVNNYAYELLNVGLHTEDECRPEDANMAIYRPLYPGCSAYENGKLYYLRPLEMFTETVTKGGRTFQRFTKITDPEVIQKLEELKKQLYQE